MTTEKHLKPSPKHSLNAQKLKSEKEEANIHLFNKPHDFWTVEAGNTKIIQHIF